MGVFVLCPEHLVWGCGAFGLEGCGVLGRCWQLKQVVLHVAEGCGRVRSRQGRVEPMRHVEHVIKVDLVFQGLRRLIKHVLDWLSSSWHLVVEVISEVVAKSCELRRLKVFLEHLVSIVQTGQVNLVELIVVVHCSHLRQRHQIVLVLERLLQLLLELERNLLVKLVDWVLLGLGLRCEQQHQLLVVLLLLLRVVGELLEKLLLKLVIGETIEAVSAAEAIVLAISTEVVPGRLVAEERACAWVRLLRCVQHVHVHWVQVLVLELEEELSVLELLILLVLIALVVRSGLQCQGSILAVHVALHAVHAAIHAEIVVKLAFVVNVELGLLIVVVD